MLTLILPFFVLVRTVFRYSHGFHLFLVLARIQQFSGAHTDSTIFAYWSGQFFGTRTDSTFCRYSHGFSNVPVHTHILPFFPYWFEQFFGTRTDSTFYRYSPGFHNFPMLTLILPFSVLVRTSLRYSHGFHLLPILARIQQCSGTHTDSTIF